MIPVLFGFVKCAGICGSCGRNDELRFGSCLDCSDHVTTRPAYQETMYIAKDEKSGKEWMARIHGEVVQPYWDGHGETPDWVKSKAASKRNALPRCVKCGGAGGQYPIAVCKKCGYDGKPKERRRSKKAGLARRFRLNLAVQKATEIGKVKPALHAANEMASMKVQRRGTRVLENAMTRGHDPVHAYEAYGASRGVQHDNIRQGGLRSRILGHAGLGSFPGAKVAAWWTPKATFPYRGDLKAIALNPETGMTSRSREIVLDEHYRRMSAERRSNIGESAILGGFSGAAFGGAVTGLRAAGHLHGTGVPLAQALKGAVKPALIGAAIGGALGLPFGVAKGHIRNMEINRAQGYTGSDIATRRNIVRTEVSQALR